jgi:ABC-type transporter Mla MlaB component
MATKAKAVSISRRKNGQYTAKFKEQLTVEYIESINEGINVIFDDAKTVNLDLAEIQSVDLSGIQLIAHIVKRCKQNDISLKVKKPFIDDVKNILEKTGFETLIAGSL